MVKIWFLHILGILVNSPELIQKVFNSEVCMEKPYIAYKLFNLDNGLLSSRYQRWKHDRRFFNNSFKISTLQTFIPIFIETADKLTATIKSHVDGEPFNILDHTIRCTLQVSKFWWKYFEKNCLIFEFFIQGVETRILVIFEIFINLSKIDKISLKFAKNSMKLPSFHPLIF